MADCITMWIQTVWPSSLAGRWLLGLVVALGLGDLSVHLFFVFLRRWLGRDPRNWNSGRRIPGHVTGLVERLFFMILVGNSVNAGGGVPALMLVWIGLKIAANWGNPMFKPYPSTRAFTIRALLGGLVSMLFALFGGWIAGGHWNMSPKSKLIQPPF